MKDDLVKAFRNQSFTEGIAILRIKFFNPANIFLQHIPVMEKVEVNRLKTNTTDTLTSVNIQ